MKTENNNKVDPYRIRKPGDLYMMLSPEGKIRSVAAGDIMYNNFREFTQDAVYYTQKGRNAPYLNDFFLHYRFADDKDVPYWKSGGNDEEYHQRVFDTIKDQGLKPHQAIRLYPAMYCYDNGLNPLLQENSQKELEKQPAYQSAVLRYSNFGERMDYPTYHGIETDKGVVLFDGTQKGEELQQKYIDFHMDNYFDARLDITFLNKIDVIPNMQQLEKVNPELDALYANGPEPFGMLPPSAYCDINSFRAVCVNNEYNMAPTNELFISFAGLDTDIKSLPDDTYDRSALLWLSDPNCNDPEIVDEFPNFFSYHDRFDPLDEKFRDVPNEVECKEVMNQVRELAGKILNEDFPNIRKQNTLANNEKQIGRSETKKEERMQKKTPPPKISTPPKKRFTPPPKKGGLKM